MFLSALLCLLAPLGLSGCGGGPARAPAPPPPGVAHQSGGAWISACAAAGVQVLAGATRVELWRLPADAPPALLADLALGQPLGPAVDHLQCGPVTTIGRGPQRWRLDLSQNLLTATQPGARTLPALPIDRALSDTRAVRVEPGRFGVTGPQGDTRWRAVSGPLTAAIWDGDVVWAVGVNGLWRWRPGPGRPMAVPLPGGWSARPLTGLFRDGPYLWVRDHAGTGTALDISHPLPALVGESGPLPVVSRARRLVAGGRQIEARLGDSRLLVDGLPYDLDAPLDAISEYRDGLLLAAGDQLRFWGGDVDLGEVWRAQTPGRSAGIFALADGRVLLVGRQYGFLALTFAAL